MTRPSELTGVPWHIETLRMNEGDTRRHRARCIFYNPQNNYCRNWKEKCRGSSHCVYYKERYVEQAEQEPKNKQAIWKSDKGTASEMPLVCDYEIGSWIKSDDYGVGRLVEAYPGRVVVDFQGKQRKFAYPQAFDNCFLFLIHPPEEITPEETVLGEKEKAFVSDMSRDTEETIEPEVQSSSDQMAGTQEYIECNHLLESSQIEELKNVSQNTENAVVNWKTSHDKKRMLLDKIGGWLKRMLRIS